MSVAFFVNTALATEKRGDGEFWPRGKSDIVFLQVQGFPLSREKEGAMNLGVKEMKKESLLYVTNKNRK